MAIALEPSSAGVIFCINMGAFLVYHTSVRLVDEQEQNRVLAEKNHQLEIQNIQFGNLNRQIAATRQARHDLRHHVHSKTSRHSGQRVVRVDGKFVGKCAGGVRGGGG